MTNAKSARAEPPERCCSMDGCGLAYTTPGMRERGRHHPEACEHSRNCPKRAEALKNPPPGCCRAGH